LRVDEIVIKHKIENILADYYHRLSCVRC